MLGARRTLLFTVWWCLCVSAYGRSADELTLFDSKGEPTAYIAEDLTIYLWDGDPVAYLFPSSAKIDIYNLDGKHLGWFERGIIRDHDGNGVGFVKGAVRMTTSIEPIKSIKSIKPIKGIREIAPIKPIFASEWSQIPLVVFLKTGITSGRRRPGAQVSTGCDAHHWISAVSDGGRILILEDGSIWAVNAVDVVTSSIWLPISNVSVCGNKIINLDDGEAVGASRASSSTYVIQASSNDETFVINGEIFKAKTYCFNMEKGDRVIFASGSPSGVCTSAEILNLRTRDVCSVWCE